MRAFSLTQRIFCFAAALSVVVCAAQSLPESFVKDCHVLTQSPHRLSGTEEYQRAAAHVAQRLQELQPDSFLEQPFVTTQLKVLDATLTPEGAAPITLVPMRPNGIIPPVTPPEGISAPIIHVGAGAAMDFETVNVEGCIAVLDYNCGQGWIRALRLGAKGIIFTRNDNADSRTAHYAQSNVNLLRYYYPGDPADLPRSGTVTIHSQVIWEPVVGKNIFAFFKGTDPVFSQNKDEVIIMAANLDSYGEVPCLAPGARGAVNCAALLQIAEHLGANRPRRHTLVAFFDNQARGHMGSSMFYRTLESDKEDVTSAKREESYVNEANFIQEMKLLLDTPTPVTAVSPVRRRLLDRLADKAQRHAHTYKNQEYLLNDEVLTYRKMYTDGFPDKIAARIEEIREERDKVTPIKHTWNELQRVIGRQKRDLQGSGGSITLDAAVSANLEQILAEVREDIELRANELAIERLALDADLALVELLGNSWISLHVSLLLGDTSERWAVIIGGESSMHSWQDNPGLYGKIQAAFLKTNQTLSDLHGSTKFLSESSDQTLPQTRVIWGAPFLIHSGEPAGLFGIYNLALGTVQEATVREGTPNDTLDRLDIARIYAQAADIARFFSATPDTPAEAADDALGNQPALSLRRGIVASKEYVIAKFDTDNSPKGPMVMGMLQGTSIPNTPMPGAIIQFRLSRNFSLAFNENKPPAFDNFQVLRTNRNGVYSLGPVTNAWGSRGGFAAIFDPDGNILEVSGDNSYPNIRWRLNTFRARSGSIVLPSQQRTDKLPGEDVKILSARANSDLDRTKSFKETVDGVVCWYSEEREKGVKLFSLRQMVGLNNGPQFLDDSAEDDDDEQIGEGFSMLGAPIAINAAARSSSDLWRLNESRMDILRAKGILDSSLAELHGRSEDILLEAANPDTSPLRREALTTTSFWASRPVYQKVRSMLDDLVFAVLILLGLSVPFAFALERVIIGATTIYKQIYWFIFFFALTFIILYLTHPAFAIANTPIIIFLGFTIIVMSTTVIFIIMRKFEFELKAIQGLTATVHVNDVSNVSTFMAAMQMGISTMRRRPTRTALTAVTIILLTFTILCFASFGTQSGVVTLFAAPNPAYSGAFVHNVNWNPLSEDLRDIIKGRWPKLTACRRLWISPKTQDNPGLLISRTDASKPLTIKGVLGVEPEELLQREDLREYFGSIDDDSILITHAVAKVLEVEPGDQVLFRGRRLTVGKLLDAVMLSAAKDMDTSSILPADFTETSSTQPTNLDGEEEMEMMAQKNWASLPVDQVAVVSADTAKTLGASLYGLIIYTEDSSEAIETAENLARILPFPIAATRQNGVYRHLLGTILKASGAKDLFFPIVLGGLVIFGTMLGSVADRQKEIYTFSALGLAPRHVATLFFAESMVYALIGGLGGYLLAQGTLKILGIASEYGLVRVPEMNMSSTNTIVTILIVMATVLISSLYPAIKASKSANPGLMRIWRPPEPEGDIMDLVFPFTVSQYDITGVVSFLQEHFGNHTDTGLGRFMTSNVQLVKEANGELGLDATLALAPFDLGVSQSFSLRSTPSEIAGIDEVRVVLRRISGQPKDWQRLNKVFLDDLRQQFLIWRSIPRQTMELYRQRTLTSLGAENNQ